MQLGSGAIRYLIVESIGQLEIAVFDDRVGHGRLQFPDRVQ